MTESIHDWNRVEVDAKTLCLFFGITSTHLIERHVREDDMPRNGPGKYPLLECIRWRFERREQQRPETVEAARQRQLTAAAIKIEVENLVRAGELIELAQVAGVMDRVMAVLGSNLDALGPRLAGPLATLDDPAKILEKVLHETRDMRRQAADQLEAIGRAVAGGPDPAPATEPKRGPVGGRPSRATTRKPRAGTVAD